MSEESLNPNPNAAALRLLLSGLTPNERVDALLHMGFCLDCG